MILDYNKKWAFFKCFAQFFIWKVGAFFFQPKQTHNATNYKAVGYRRLKIDRIVKIEMSYLFGKKVKQSRIQKSLLCPFGFSAKVIQLLCNLRGSLNIVDYFCCMRVFVFLFCGLFLFFCFLFCFAVAVIVVTLAVFLFCFGCWKLTECNL